MDLNALLPLLMSKTGANSERMNTLFKLAKGEKPDMGTVMNMAMQNRPKNNFFGLKSISGIASDEIMGKIARHFL